MLNTICVNLDVIRTITSYRLLSHTIRESLAANRSLAVRHFLNILAFCLIFSFAPATAGAQASATKYSVSTVTAASSGWWSPEQTGFVTPHLQLNCEINLSGDLRGATSSHNNYGAQQENPIANVMGFGSQLQAENVISLVQSQPLSSRTLLPLLEANYAAWESRLADTRTLINVNGVSVYPLAQIDYAGWHLPITLYISPVR